MKNTIKQEQRQASLSLPGASILREARKIFLIAVFFIAAGSVMAQKFAYVDTDYILNKIPSYTAALKQLDELSQKYQSELQTKMSAIEQMYRSYQNEASRLSDAERRAREDAIIAKEQEHRNLQQQYFGQDGSLSKKQSELLGPIQERVSGAVSSVAGAGGYSVIFDKASGATIIYTDPNIDVSDQVLQKLGYK